MPRPETIKDVKDRRESIGRIDFDKISTIPTLLRHYTALIEALQKMDGEAEAQYQSVNMYMPKNIRQLQDQLKTEQRRWDDYQKLYNRAVRANPEDEPIKEYEKSGITEWAMIERLPDPFDVFAANDPELAKIRATLGMDD